jgi:hypothetical protein
MTARALIDRGKREKAFGIDGKLHMLAIAGDRSTPSSINRNQGMRRAISEDARVVSTRRFTQPGLASWEVSKPSRSTGAIRMPSSFGRATI